MAKKDSQYIYLKKNEVDIIASTPSNECWMCNTILDHIHIAPHNKQWFRISLRWLDDNDMTEHLEQILGELSGMELMEKELERIC